MPACRTTVKKPLVIYNSDSYAVSTYWLMTDATFEACCIGAQLTKYGFGHLIIFSSEVGYSAILLIGVIASHSTVFNGNPSQGPSG